MIPIPKNAWYKNPSDQLPSQISEKHTENISVYHKSCHIDF